MRRIFAAILLTLAMAIGVFAQEKQENKLSEFIRYQTDNKDSGLQIAVTDYIADVGTRSVTVTLYGVVHIADSDYYKKVQKDLDGYDTVLYEGVGGDKQKMAQKQAPSILSVIQHLAGDILDLSFQMDSIDYTRKNLVHADISSMDDLKEKMNGESISPLGNYIKEDQLEFLKPIMDAAGPLLKELMKTQPQWQNKIKAQFAETLSSTDINTQLSPELHKTIVLDRNQIVIDVLQRELKTGKSTYAVFYGAAHMPDLEERLQKLGFKQKSKRWMTAWKIKPVSDDDEERAPPRAQKRLNDRGRGEVDPDHEDK